MFEKQFYYCPNCAGSFRDDLKVKSVVTCRSCRSRYNVIFDEDSGKIALVEEKSIAATEPLNLPKGSIRAMTTIAVSISCWTYVFMGRTVPDFLVDLMLAIIGYYFGFRTKAQGAETRIHDASIEKQDPLFLPAGFIRGFLIIGFLVCGILVFNGKVPSSESFMGFFVVIAGLIAGYVFSRIFAGLRGTSVFNLVQHVKGLVVLGSAASLLALLISGKHAEFQSTCLVLSSLISFYFGSRT